MLKVCVIDSSPITLKGVSILLDKHFSVVQLSSVRSLAEYQSQENQALPNLIIIGINDLGINLNETGQSIKTILECRSFFGAVPLIVFEETYSPGSTSSYFRLGVKGHLLKRCSENDFVKCIDQVLSDKYYLSPELHVRTLVESGRS
jgi:DNA-binding NarL/FixJ family response regulator